MKIIVSAGGTGGHLYPALALVDYIKTQNADAEFLFVGTTDRLESQVVPQMGYAYQGLYVKGLTGSVFQKLKNVFIFLRSIKHSKKILKTFKPDIVIGFGGYPSASIVMAATRLNIPTMIHEQNSIIGLTNKVLIRKVNKIICCYQKAYENFPQEKTLLLGNPRASVVSSQVVFNAHEVYNIAPSRKFVVIVMGSLGSSSMNKVMKEALEMFSDDSFDVVYVTGKSYYEQVCKEWNHLPSHIHLVSYVEDMPSLIASCDLIVSRAGATTLAEITALGVASLLIPSPYVVANHQEYNAQELKDAEAAHVLLEKDFDAHIFVSEVRALMNDDATRAYLKANAKKLGTPDACQKIYEEMLKM